MPHPGPSLIPYNTRHRIDLFSGAAASGWIDVPCSASLLQVLPNEPSPADAPPPLGSRVGFVGEESRSTNDEAGVGSDDPSENDGPSVGSSGGSALGLSFQFAGSLLVFTLGGHFLDGRLDSSPLFLLLGVAAGLVGGFLSMIYHVRRLNSR